MSSAHTDGSTWTTTINLLDGPAQHRLRGSSMLSPPTDLRVAVHRDAPTIAKVAHWDDCFQESLWRIALYRRKPHHNIGVAYYTFLGWED